MEETKTKRNFIPIIVLVAILGFGAAALAKPGTDAKTQVASTSDSGATLPNSILGGITGGGKTNTNVDPATFCETPWAEAGVPNVPNFGEGEHVCGNPNAKIMIVEYTDLECPFCKQFHPTLQKIVAESNGTVGWVLRHYPIDGLHSKARHEAEATECAADQMGEVGFWKYTDKVFEVTSSNNSLSPALLPLIADQIGLNKEAFATCLASGKFLPKIAAQAKLAEDKGPIGTPNSRLFIGGKEVEEVSGAVDYNTLKSKIDLWMKAE
ncbi:MAG: hypothetical protein RL641_278 [Candidatus Parcubacteria bacterium]|jgi:protein-disulfide isomerase